MSCHSHPHFVVSRRMYRTWPPFPIPDVPKTCLQLISMTELDTGTYLSANFTFILMYEAGDYNMLMRAGATRMFSTWSPWCTLDAPKPACSCSP